VLVLVHELLSAPALVGDTAPSLGPAS